ncbi:MAG: polyprenyl synthetase family protein [Spirochaetes bacterium]|nr:polyprenyl synthetase family protein [Spirochaetota bacterium]
MACTTARQGYNYTVLLSPQRVIADTNKAIHKILGGELRILKKIREYVVASGGKRIRPLFQYYLGAAYGVDSRTLISLGALIEIVHAASLLHDDVVDNADERRSRPTGAKLFGNKQVVLAGDHLLSSGLKYLSSMNNPAYMQIFTDSIQALTEAELMQMQYHFDLQTSTKIHNAIVDGKTATLFRAAGALVAAHRKSAELYASESARLGLEFGRYFQERDDYLDYFDATRLKKKGLQDFLNGIVTQPLILLLAHVNRHERKFLATEWEYARRHGKIQSEAGILSLMKKYTIQAFFAGELAERQTALLAGLAQLPEKRPREIIKAEFEKILAVRTL